MRSSATSFYNADGLGTITSLANTAGSLAETYTFDSSGNQTASSGSLTNPFQYTARENDPETGLYYYRARYYDESAGRFLSEDPMGFDAGVDFYSYTLNSPLNFGDPSGMDIAVIENGPTEGNPIGHTAIAITGHGIYSFGNDTPCGSSPRKYLQREAPRRNTRIWIIKTTAAQDAAALADLQKEGTCQRKLPYTYGNCSSISNSALSAADIPDLPLFGLTGEPFPDMTPWPTTAGLRAAMAGASSVSIPKNSPTIPGGLQGFEPH